MEQPELGKKITELRLAKGLTQSELADQCNIGLRTIQRIESAEVTPRSYTLKLIFQCLDYEMFNSSGKSAFEKNEMAHDSSAFRTGGLDIFDPSRYTLRTLALVSIPFISLILFFSLSGFQENETLAPYSVAELNRKYVHWFNDGQIDSIGFMYQKNACYIPFNHTEIHGRRNIVKWYNDLYESGFRFYKNESKAVIVTDSIIVERGVWHANNKTNMTGTYLTQWRRTNGKWYVENGMSNGDNIY